MPTASTAASLCKGIYLCRVKNVWTVIVSSIVKDRGRGSLNLVQTSDIYHISGGRFGKQGGWSTRTGHTLVVLPTCVADQEAHNAGIALQTRGVENYLLGLASKIRLSSNSNILLSFISLVEHGVR